MRRDKKATFYVDVCLEFERPTGLKSSGGSSSAPHSANNIKVGNKKTQRCLMTHILENPYSVQYGHLMQKFQ